MKERNKNRNARSHVPACSRKPTGWKLPPGTLDQLKAFRQRELSRRGSVATPPAELATDPTPSPPAEPLPTYYADTLLDTDATPIDPENRT